MLVWQLIWSVNLTRLKNTYKLWKVLFWRCLEGCFQKWSACESELNRWEDPAGCRPHIQLPIGLWQLGHVPFLPLYQLLVFGPYHLYQWPHGGIQVFILKLRVIPLASLVLKSLDMEWAMLTPAFQGLHSVGDLKWNFSTTIIVWSNYLNKVPFINLSIYLIDSIFLENSTGARSSTEWSWILKEEKHIPTSLI